MVRLYLLLPNPDNVSNPWVGQWLRALADLQEAPRLSWSFDVALEAESNPVRKRMIDVLAKQFVRVQDAEGDDNV